MVSHFHLIELTEENLKLLQKLYTEYHAWLVCANGLNPTYQHPLARIYARDNAKQAMAKYFEMIELLVPKE